MKGNLGGAQMRSIENFINKSPSPKNDLSVRGIAWQSKTSEIQQKPWTKTKYKEQIMNQHVPRETRTRAGEHS